MPRRSNPWPALVDLFGALLLVCLGGMVTLAVSAKRSVTEDIEREMQRREAAEFRAEIEQAVEGLKESGGSLIKDVRSSGNDVKLDLDLQFDTNDERVRDADRARLAEFCRQLSEYVRKRYPEPSQRARLQLVVEGHSDDTLASDFKDPRAQFLHNWNLSSRRASSVMWELCGCGLIVCEGDRVNTGDLNEQLVGSVQAVGYASSRPLRRIEDCGDDIDACRAVNRRITVRLRIGAEKEEEESGPESAALGNRFASR